MSVCRSARSIMEWDDGRHLLGDPVRHLRALRRATRAAQDESEPGRQRRGRTQARTAGLVRPAHGRPVPVRRRLAPTLRRAAPTLALRDAGAPDGPGRARHDVLQLAGQQPKRDPRLSHARQPKDGRDVAGGHATDELGRALPELRGPLQRVHRHKPRVARPDALVRVERGPVERRRPDGPRQGRVG